MRRAFLRLLLPQAPGFRVYGASMGPQGVGFMGHQGVGFMGHQGLGFMELQGS